MSKKKGSPLKLIAPLAIVAGVGYAAFRFIKKQRARKDDQETGDFHDPIVGEQDADEMDKASLDVNVSLQSLVDQKGEPNSPIGEFHDAPFELDEDSIGSSPLRPPSAQRRNFSGAEEMAEAPEMPVNGGEVVEEIEAVEAKENGQVDAAEPAEEKAPVEQETKAVEGFPEVVKPEDEKPAESGEAVRNGSADA